jgi:type I restriction enzyme, S subunit
MSDELPQGWCNALLFDICRPKQWQTVATKDLINEGYPVYGANGRIGFYHSFNHEEPTILVTCRGATCGVLNLTDGRAWVTGNAMALDNLDEGVVALKYAYYALKNRGFADVVTGSAQPQITRESLRVVELPLAPLAEQRRIVAKLEKLLGKVDACQRRLKKLPVLLKRFRQSLLAVACSGRLTADWRQKNPDVRVSDSLCQRAAKGEGNGDLPPSWIACQVGDVMKLKNGFAFKSSDYSDKGVPLIRISNIQDRKVSLDDCARLPAEKSNWNFAVEKGDLLVAMSGATTGKFGSYYGDEHCLQNQRVGNIKILDASEVLPGFRNIALQSLKARIEEDAYGGAQPNISPAKIEALPFACPPLAEQKEITRRVESLFALGDQIEARYVKAKAYIEKLTPSLLARAFRGELVPQDPNDEPASALLERLKKNRSKSDHARKRLALRTSQAIGG